MNKNNKWQQSKEEHIIVPPIQEEAIGAEPDPRQGDDIGSEPVAYEIQEGTIRAGDDFNLGAALDMGKFQNSVSGMIVAPTQEEIDEKEAAWLMQGAARPAMFPIPPIDHTQVALMIEEAKQELRDEFAQTFGGGHASETISVNLIGGQFECPKCGLYIQGPGATGMRGDLYEHPFSESTRLGPGKQCDLKGAKFRPPTVFLQRVIKPLTAKKQ